MSDKPAEVEVELTATSGPKSEPTVTPQFCPLFGGHLRIRVELPPPEGSPFPPAWAVVVPFTPAESLKYLAEMEALKGKSVEQDAEQRKRLAPQIKEWNYLLVGDTVAPINLGTVTMVPTWAMQEIELATLGVAGKLLGN